MFSFSSLAVLATVAFSAVSSAIPLTGDGLPRPGWVPPVPAVPAVPGALKTVPNGLPALPAVGGVLPRVDTPDSIAVVLTTVHAQLVPVTTQLKFVTAANCTLEVVSVPLGEVKTILTGAVTSLHALVGQPVEVILRSVEGTAQITVKELGHLVAGVVIIVFEALGAVLKVAGKTVDKVLFKVLCDVGGLVGLLLAAVFGLLGHVVGEVVVVVVPLLKAVIPFILHLNIATVISLLHL
ncbi:hypothetical protein C8Q76DRAFT_804160 [Earliella scabrosa]|nr:hypothetical protein C8Q76DRAFT_804160 [Earliella scabrosa]